MKVGFNSPLPHLDAHWLKAMLLPAPIILIHKHEVSSPHRAAPYGTLFSDIDCGEGLRMFDSAGAFGRGPHTGARTTFWNLRGSRERDRCGLGVCVYVETSPWCPHAGISHIAESWEQSLISTTCGELDLSQSVDQSINYFMWQICA